MKALTQITQNSFDTRRGYYGTIGDECVVKKHGKMTIRMAYEMVMPYHLHMPSYFLETFTEYP